jgi:hypothetical protein
VDPEKSMRKLLLTQLSPYFFVLEEVALRSKLGENIRADLLLSFQNEEFSTLIAIEIKSLLPSQPKNYRDTLYQAYKYVGATTTDARL